MNELLEQITKAWDSLSLRQKMSLFVSAGLTVGAVMTIVWWAGIPTWTPLSVNVEARSAQEMIQALQSASIPVQTADGGGTIEVPAESLEEAKRVLASKDLLGLGSEGGDDYVTGSNMGESTRTMEWRMKRAQESRLARTLEEVTWIRKARVHLTLAGSSPFVDDRDVAKASIQVTVAKGFRPGSAQAQGIVNLVRDSVPELIADNISVTDQTGRPIVDGQADSEVGGVAANKQLEIRNQVERDITKSIALMLEPILGREGFAIQANATLDYQKTKRFLKTFDPDGSVLLSESKNKTKNSSGRAGASGAPGTASNLPGGGPPSGGIASNEQRSDQLNNYENSFEETTIEEPSGTLQKVSVSVVIDQKSEAVEGQEEPQVVPRDDAEMQEIERIVKAAMGFDEERGDALVVSQRPFRHGPVIEPESTLDPLSFLPLVKWPALVLLLLIAFFLFYKPTLKTVQGMITAGKAPGGEEGDSAELERQLQLGPPSRLELMRQRLAKLAAEQPEGMAQTMRVWLNEETE